MAAIIATTKNFLSLVKFSHTIFALPFAMIGFFSAVKLTESSFDIFLLAKVVLCMVFARSAAMAFNRYLDRQIDAKNPRTKIREIPSGIITEKSALAFTISNCILFVGTTFFINNLCFALSPVALAVVLGYSFTKRFTSLCHLVLGLGLSLAPIGAYIAVSGSFALLPVLLSIVVLCWVSGFDIIYALQDEDFDKSENLFSIPVVFGKKGALVISRILHTTCAVILLLIGSLFHFEMLYFVGTVLFIGLLIYQHSIVKPNDLSKVNIAFFTTNGIASILYAVFYISNLYL
ncbi:MAG: UbiA family prenyltransferase [Bacteroidetes bacterium]|nr:UbiA family prenyltransferase [Bacteroidota bacterium]